MESTNQDTREAIAKQQEAGIPVFPWMEFFAEQEPELAQSYSDWTVTARELPNLDRKIQELIVVALDAVLGWPSPYIDAHIRKALECGATVKELCDTVLVAGRLMGPHAMNNGFTAVRKVVLEDNIPH